MTAHLSPSQAKHIKGVGKTADEYDPQKDGAGSYLVAIEAKRARGDTYYLRDKIMSVELPWPSRDLHPNARIHWSKRAKAAKQARADAAWWAKHAGVRPINADALSVTIIFYPPDNRRRDVDGMLASLKPALDGIADVVGVDDSKWQIALRKEAPRPPFGALRVEIVGKGGL